MSILLGWRFPRQYERLIWSGPSLKSNPVVLKEVWPDQPDLDRCLSITSHYNCLHELLLSPNIFFEKLVLVILSNLCKQMSALVLICVLIVILLCHKRGVTQMNQIEFPLIKTISIFAVSCRKLEKIALAAYRS